MQMRLVARVRSHAVSKKFDLSDGEFSIVKRAIQRRAIASLFSWFIQWI